MAKKRKGKSIGGFAKAATKKLIGSGKGAHTTGSGAKLAGNLGLRNAISGALSSRTDKPGKGTIGKSYTDMFGRTIGNKDRKQVNLRNTKQVVNEDGTLTRHYYDYDNNPITSKTMESAGASQKAARDAGFTGDPVVAGKEYREMKKNEAIFAAHDAKNKHAEQMRGEQGVYPGDPRPPKPTRGKRTLTAAQKAALSSDVYAKKGGSIKKKSGGSVKKKRAKTVKSKYTTGNKRYSNGGKIYPR